MQTMKEYRVKVAQCKTGRFVIYGRGIPGKGVEYRPAVIDEGPTDNDREACILKDLVTADRFRLSIASFELVWADWTVGPVARR